MEKYRIDVSLFGQFFLYKRMQFRCDNCLKVVFLLLVLNVLLPFGVWAQVLEGKVTDEQRVAIEGATLFVRETTQGCVTDENGCFRLALPVGKYTCEFRSLGYEKSVMQLTVRKEMPLLTVELKPITYMLKEIRITAKGEDPAYYIMRKAIAKAPFHRNQIESYTSEVYTKGTAKLDKLPKLLSLMPGLRKEIEPYVGKVFVLESQMEVSFQAPDQYQRNILAFSSTIPDEMSPEEALGIVTVSIYEPSLAGIVSPLTPGAFSYYRFRLDRCYQEGERTINKIEVIPRKQNSQLLSGWIYIVEDEWSVMSFNFSMRSMGSKLKFKCVFNEVRPTVFLPTSYDIDMDVKFMGVEAGGKYYASLKYKEVVVRSKDTPLVQRDSVIDQFVGKKKEKNLEKRRKLEKQLDELEAKEEVTTREAYRMARLSQELISSQKRRDTISPFEIRTLERLEKVKVDSMAMQRDSLYWLTIRTIPLKEYELVSYQRKDSLQKVVKQMTTERDSFLGDYEKFRFEQLLWGGHYRFGKRVWFSFDGLVWAVPEYNFVDGFRIGQSFKLSVYLKDDVHLNIQPALYYTTARRTLFWHVNGKLDYAPFRGASLVLKGGDVSKDFNGDSGIERLENTITSLVCADNFMKLYRARYVAFSHRMDVANGLKLEVGGDYEDRQVLMNRISYNFCGRDVKPNTPAAEGGVNMPDNSALTFSAHLTYTPYAYYQLKGRRKEYMESVWPTLGVGYEKGLSVSAENNNVYDRLEAGISQKINLSIFDQISYAAEVGKYLSVKELYFVNYKHFNTVGWLVSQDVFMSGFCMADYYALYSRDRWAKAAFNYRSSYLLLKRLPFMQRFMFDEAVHGRYVWTPDLKSYAECGYSVGFMQGMRLGVFVGFDHKGYQGVGVRVGLPFTWKIGY